LITPVVASIIVMSRCIVERAASAPPMLHLMIFAPFDCGNKVIDGLLTCDNIEHQEIEKLHHERGQSHFQLHKWLEHACVIIHPTTSESNLQALLWHTMLDNDDEKFTINPNGCVTADTPKSEEVPQDPSATKSKKAHAKLTQSRTHNEQLMVAPCGMILGWDMMLGQKVLQVLQ